MKCSFLLNISNFYNKIDRQNVSFVVNTHIRSNFHMFITCKITQHWMLMRSFAYKPDCPMTIVQRKNQNYFVRLLDFAIYSLVVHKYHSKSIGKLWKDVPLTAHPGESCQHRICITYFDGYFSCWIQQRDGWGDEANINKCQKFWTIYFHFYLNLDLN